MKYKGFTLAEVLITLGIIGVIAALTAPALYQDVSNAHIGPTLSKFKSTLENANYQMLNDAGATDLQELVGDGEFSQSLTRDRNGNLVHWDRSKQEVVIDGLDTKSDQRYLQMLTQYIQGSNYIGCNADGILTETGLRPSPSNWNQSNGGNTYGWRSYRKLELMNNVTMMITNMNNNHQDYYTNDVDSNLRGFLADIVVDINGRERGPNKRGMDLFDFVIDRSGAVLPTGGIQFAKGKQGTIRSTHHWTGNNRIYACNENTVTEGEACTGSIFENKLKVIYK